MYVPSTEAIYAQAASLDVPFKEGGNGFGGSFVISRKYFDANFGAIKKYVMKSKRDSYFQIDGEGRRQCF